LAVTLEDLKEIALSLEEYQDIQGRLDREPNSLELGLFGALWSEHCAYKHSRPLLRLFPSDSPRVLVAPGAENAGVVDVGDGQSIVFKIESHNHPSAVEPFQGAATGVGGIVRDILAMGARPIALLNSLRFGPPDSPRGKHLFHGVVEGISWYGNCLGVPDVGGEIDFSSCYEGNPLVNAMCIGTVRTEDLVRAKPSGPGDLLLLVGADTGRDGIHGASGLASQTFSDDRELRTTVQVGNPFMEKVLIEACLEALQVCREGIAGMQDLGAAGLTSATVECVSTGGRGLILDVAKVPRRESGMSPYEVMLSESQERMMLLVRPGYVDQVKAVFDKWDLMSSVIGEVTDDATVRIVDGDTLSANVPVVHLIDAPQYRLIGTPSKEIDAARNINLNTIPLPSITPAQALLQLMGSANLASRAAVYRQYDQQVQANTVVPPGMGDAAVLLLRDDYGGSSTGKGIAVSTDGNSRMAYLDPYVGGQLVIAEACRNVSCVGAEPIALTDCLNFGNPERPEVYYQLEECIKGMADACRALGVPVVSGNVSLYNESGDQAIHPTPVVGALGLLEDVDRHCDAVFRHTGDVVVLLGAGKLNGDASSLAGSEALEVLHGTIAGKPHLDIDLEARVQKLCRTAIGQGLLSSAHDCSEGGLAVALAESCILGGQGVSITATTSGRWDATLFGEDPSRILVSVHPDKLAELKKLATRDDVPLLRLGLIGGDHFKIGKLLDVPLSDVEHAWRSGLETLLWD
jgi:phosphoribosylformylglycinamidine synthase II